MNFITSALRPGRTPVGSVEDGTTGPVYHQQASDVHGQIPTESQNRLATFRHMVGICPTDSAGVSHNPLHFAGRTAINLGIYNRVCHREQQAKRSYKSASILINGCLGVQIVVAAALTAMGAAGTSRAGVTTFGAINTIIAGLLTYLKGSGLPNRIRYYEHEWKKIREYIEQREREISRPDCTLDVYEVVRHIEAMYEEVKADVRQNTPDSYVGVGDKRSHLSMHVPQINVSDEITRPARVHANKLMDMETKYGPKIVDFLENLAHKEEDRLRGMGMDVKREVEKSAEIGKAQVDGAVNQLREDLGVEQHREKARAWGTDLSAEVSNVRDTARQGYASTMQTAIDQQQQVINKLDAGAGLMAETADEVHRHAAQQRDATVRLAKDVDDVVKEH